MLKLPQLFSVAVLVPLDEAARLIAQHLLDGYLRFPRVTLTARGRTVTHTPVIEDNVRVRDRAYADHLAYLREQTEPAIAVSNYQGWIAEHRDDDLLIELTPKQACQRALQQTRPSPTALKLQEWHRMLKVELRIVQTLSTDEARHRLDAVKRMQTWVSEHQSDPEFSSTDLSAQFAKFRIETLPDLIPRSTLPATPKMSVEADIEARVAHNDKFLLLAQLLRGDHPIESYRRILDRASARDVSVFKIAIQLGVHPRAAPRVIEVPSEGYDILIHGDPARRFALGLLASAIMQWATDRLHDPDFVKQDPLSVALTLMEHQGFNELFAWAGTQPLATESMERHDILVDRALLAFGTTVLTGLAVVALVGVAVGAGIVTGGAATVVLLGVAGTMAGAAYLERREEIEQQNYDVPIPFTALHAVGDVLGLSQLIEGLTGERLGTRERLRSIERSEQLGTGVGGLATVLLASRAYRLGYMS